MMKYYCHQCGNELEKTDAGRSHWYYLCRKSLITKKGCGQMYGILGKRFWWSVPAIDELTGEIVFEYKMTADGSFRIEKNET